MLKDFKRLFVVAARGLWAVGLLVLTTSCAHSHPADQNGAAATAVDVELGSFNAVRHQIKIVGSYIENSNIAVSENDPGLAVGTFSTPFDTYSVKIRIGSDDESPVELVVETQGGMTIARRVSEIGITKRREVDGQAFTFWLFKQAFDVDGFSVYIWSFNRGVGPRGESGLCDLFLCSAPQYAMVEVDGEAMHLAVFDGDLDGAIGSSEDRWLLLDQPMLAKFNARHSGTGYLYGFYKGNMTRADHPVYLSDDRAVYLDRVEGRRASLCVRRPDKSRQQYLHQLVSEHHRKRFESMLRDYQAEWDELEPEVKREFEPEPGRSKAKTPIAWEYVYDLKEVQARAEREGKPLFVDFVSLGCGWCSVLDQVAFADAEVAAYINKRFIPVRRVGFLVAKFTPKHYEINASPTLMLTRGDGTEIGRTVGSAPASEYMSELERLNGLWENHRTQR